jgi:hypothetical protein
MREEGKNALSLVLGRNWTPLFACADIGLGPQCNCQAKRPKRGANLRLCPSPNQSSECTIVKYKRQSISKVIRNFSSEEEATGFKVSFTKKL